MALNRDQIIKKLKNREKVIVEVPTSESNLLAHIIIKPTASGGAVLTGYPMQASPKCKLDTKTTRRTALSINTIDLNIRDLTAAVEAKYKRENRPKVERKKKDDDRDTIVQKLKGIKDELLNPGNYEKYIHKRWAESTTEAAVNFLICSIAPAMDQCGEDIDAGDMIQIKANLIVHASNNGRGKPTKEGQHNPKDPDTVESNFEDRYRRAGVVYQWARDHHPEFELPDVEFVRDRKAKKNSVEKAKALPDDIRVRLANLIVLLCSVGVGLACGVALEFFCGLRVAEAAAPLIGELILITEDNTFIYGKYFVGHQIDKHGKRTACLKRNSSKRYVPLTSAMVQIVQMRIEQLKATGFSMEQIVKMPFVSTNQAPDQFVNRDSLAEFAKKLLTLAGCDDEFMKSASIMMYKYPEFDDDGTPVLDVSSHLCRRDYATRMKGHFSALELDAVLGHENPGNIGKDYASNDTMRRLAREAEVCFTFDAEMTQNPAYRPIHLTGNEDIHLIGNTGYRLENCTDQDIVIDFDLTNLEPNDPMYLQVDSSRQIKKLRRRTPIDTQQNRLGRRIRNRQIDLSYIRKWKKEAKDMDISSLQKKYS